MSTERSLSERARDVLLDAARRSEPGLGLETLTVAEAVGGEVVATLRVQASQPEVAERPVRRLLHPYGSGSALVFQAFWSDAERTSYLRRHPFAVLGGHVWDGLGALEEFLRGVRAEGVADVPFGNQGMTRLSVPVFGESGQVVAVLSGVARGAEDGPGREQISRRLRGLLIDAAQQLSTWREDG